MSCTNRVAEWFLCQNALIHYTHTHAHTHKCRANEHAVHASDAGVSNKYVFNVYVYSPELEICKLCNERVIKDGNKNTKMENKNHSTFLAHSMSLCNREASVVRLSVRPSVCKLCANRYFYHRSSWIATKLAHDGPQKSPHPGCAQGQGQGQRSRDTDTFLTTQKSLLLPQTWLDRHQTYTTWSPHGPASRMCSRSLLWCHEMFAIQCLLTFCLYVHSLYEALLHSPSSTSVRQLDVMSTSWNELRCHWRSGSPVHPCVRPCVRPEILLAWYLAEYLTHFHQTYISDALMDRDEGFTIWGQSSRSQWNNVCWNRWRHTVLDVSCRVVDFLVTV